jgi:hypothetical protein
MSFTATNEAIGSVTQALVEQLQSRTKLAVTAGRPSQAGASTELNLFLYQASFDASMKNLPLDKGQVPPLWLILKYIITAFDGNGESDNIDAHKNLGRGLQALQEMSMLNLIPALPASVLDALQDNPEELKLTFDEVTSELLSKLMQGPDDKYRFSMGFQVRPVMITAADLPSYNLLVGIDYTVPKEIGERGIHIDVLPSLGPKIDEVLPAGFEHNAVITITGTDFDPDTLTVTLGGKKISVEPESTGVRLVCTVDTAIGAGGLSAGSHALQAVQTLSSGTLRSSNLLICHLLPAITAAPTFTLETGDPASYFGTLRIRGILLGAQFDDIFLALYRDDGDTGRVIKLFSDFEEFKQTPVPVTQDSLSVRIPAAERPAAGAYRVILRVNGEQARQSPQIIFT